MAYKFKTDFTLPKAKSTSFSPSKQSQGIKNKLTENNINTKKLLDNRNIIERGLNLTPEQNFLFDIFEVLERPQQAIFGGIKALQEGGDFLEGAKKGITGNDVTRFKEILNKAGLTEDSGSKFGVDDVMGFVGDVLLDPADLALIPVTGGASLADDVVQAGAKGAKTVMKSPLQLLGGGIGKGIKGAGGKVDELIEGALKKSDLKPIMNSKGELVAPAVNFSNKGVLEGSTKGMRASELGADASGRISRLEAYKDFKNRLGDTFNLGAQLPEGTLDKLRKISGEKGVSRAKVDEIGKLVKKKIDNLARQKGAKTAEEVAEISNKIGEDVFDLFEFMEYRPKMKRGDLFQFKTVPFDKSAERTIAQLAKKMGVEVDDLRRIDTLEDGRKVIVFQEDLAENIMKDPNLQKFLDAEIGAPRFYTKADRDRFKLLREDADFMKTYDEVKDGYRHARETVDKVMGLNGHLLKQKGYMTHSINKALDPFKEMQRKAFGYMKTAPGGDVNAFTGRKYWMSNAKANELFNVEARHFIENNAEATGALAQYYKSVDGKELFEKTVQSSFDDFLVSTPEAIGEAKKIDQLLLGTQFANTDTFMPIQSGMKTPPGYKKIRNKDLKRKLEKVSNAIDSPDIKKLLGDLENGQDIAIDSRIISLLGKMEDTKQINGLLSLFNSVNNLFKKTKLLSPGFQMRNWAGNMSNMYLAGMKPYEIASEMTKAKKVMDDIPSILEKYARKEALTDAEKLVMQDWQEFTKLGFGSFTRQLYDIPEKFARKVDDKGLKKLNKVAEASADWNEKFDTTARMAMYRWSKKQSKEFLADAGVNAPGDLVRRALFDFNDLSDVERNAMRKIVPFYTFTKKNLAFQMKNIGKNPTRYKNLNRTMRMLWEDVVGIDTEDELADYQRENFWIPVWKTKNGKAIALKSSLPLADVGEFAQTPFRKIAGSISPLIKAPFELASNKEMFLDREISSFRGQKGNTFGLPAVPEYLFKQTGLDVPTRGVMDLVEGAYKGATGQQDLPTALRTAVGRTVFSDVDPVANRIGKDYEELNQLQEALKFLKQEGVSLDVPVNPNRNQNLDRVQVLLEKINKPFG